MRILLLYFLPAFLPIMLYLISHYIAVRKAKQLGIESPKLIGEGLLRIFMLSLVITIITFIVIFITFESSDKAENYQRERIIDGVITKE